MKEKESDLCVLVQLRYYQPSLSSSVSEGIGMGALSQWLNFPRPVYCQRLGRLQDSNAVLSHFNEYSEHCFAEVSSEFSRNTRLLRSMKSDLDYIFQKLSLKAKILATYPDAFPDDSTIEALDRRPDLEMPH
ncbi:kxDL motif-containing protein LO9-177-like isoform X1 [Rhododendron vialii]|uniref:kxDL motif-containing protein LO9-177-like isoform X1 n=1 Tax=Rhododendron vialii TaxID=182163 RepID=UPI00265FF61D|nr:kxDL motif-containing protein LO9-177-like isoform X1 [Rhododendron vialii]